MTPSPSYTRLFEVPEKFGVSQSTVTRWSKLGRITIYKPTDRIALVNNEEMQRAIMEGVKA